MIPFTRSPLLIVASAKTSITSLKDFIALAKQKPGELNFGSTGVGIPLYLTMEMLRSAAGVELVHIPFKGDAPLLQSLIAGDIQVACVPFATSLPHIQAGTLRALAVTTAERVAVLADVPTRRGKRLSRFSNRVAGKAGSYRQVHRAMLSRSSTAAAARRWKHPM